ncbi:MAG: hypothetical protein ACFB13_21775, partial [Kiloniellaceae bacterium]
GLLLEAGQDLEGIRPVRQLYEITPAGRRALAALRREGLREVWFKYDPFDLALTQIDPAALESLPSVLSGRLDQLRAMLVQSQEVNEVARPKVGLAKQWALRHTEYRLEAEIAYLTDLLGASGDIVADERKLRPGKPKAG